MVKKKEIKKDKKDLIKINKEIFKKEAFLLEEDHPAIGRILIVDGEKFKVLDDTILGSHRSGTFIKKFTEEDQERIDEYEEALELLSEKLKEKVDIKRIIRENLKQRAFQDLKTGLYILEAQEKGEKVQEEEGTGCYELLFHHNNHTFRFVTGADVDQIIHREG